MLQQPDASISPHENDSTNPYWIPMILGGLLFWRWMQPVEASISGSTLLIAQFSLFLPILVAVWFWCSRIQSILWGPLDYCLWGIIIGHWCSLFWLISSGGDLRAALNLCWEWTAVGCSFFSLRQVTRFAESQHDLIRLVLILGIGMAGLGLWQHYVSYRFVLSDYESLAASYDRLSEKAATGLSRLERQEFQRLQRELQEMQIPMEGPAREMFERRLADNRQPVGRWALTNSLGGLLAVTVILCATALSGGGWRRWLAALVLLMTAVCLWHTGSRTAQAATIIGLVWLAIEKWGGTGRRLRLARITVLGLSITVGLIAVTVGIRGLDSITVDSHYALRSLQFRLQYWIGSFRALVDSPLFGTGPGNFRQVYLQFKLPESSEQILDPHNALLDLWANGGLIALSCGLFSGSILLRRLVTAPASVKNSTGESQFWGWLSSPWILGAELGLLLLFLGTLLTTGEPDWPLLTFVFVLPVLDVLVIPFTQGLPAQSIRIGCLVLGVHLLGAGGMEMPGIVLLGLCLLSVSEQPGPGCCQVTGKHECAMILVGIFLLGSMWWTTTGPVRAAQRDTDTAYLLWGIDQNERAARNRYLAATEQDPYASENWRLLANMEYLLWLRNPENRQLFEAAIDAWQQARTRDPKSFKDARSIADAYWDAYTKLKEKGDALQATKWYELTDSLLPYDEQILSRFAFAAQAANLRQKSRSAAKNAIRIDEISRKNGHWEKLLSEETLDKLREIESGED